jgi:putative transposase
MGADFCSDVLHQVLHCTKLQIFNSDQRSQFTSRNCTSILKAAGIMTSMYGLGRVYDNIFVERLRRSVKYEVVYLKEYATVQEAVSDLGAYFRFYNEERPHQALKYKTPHRLYTRRCSYPVQSDNIHSIPGSTLSP